METNSSSGPAVPAKHWKRLCFGVQNSSCNLMPSTTTFPKSLHYTAITPGRFPAITILMIRRYYREWSRRRHRPFSDLRKKLDSTNHRLPIYKITASSVASIYWNTHSFQLSRLLWNVVFRVPATLRKPFGRSTAFLQKNTAGNSFPAADSIPVQAKMRHALFFSSRHDCDHIIQNI